MERLHAQAADSVSERMEVIAAAKRTALQDYIIAFNTQILQPIQIARGVLAVHPHFPDGVKLGALMGAGTAASQ